MKYAILGDIHANLEALTATLEDADSQGAERFVCTGDIVGYNADPKACLHRLRAINCQMVQGNHDYYAACNENMDLFTPMARRSIHWTRKQLSSFDRKFLRELPMILDIDAFTIVHSSLSSPQRWNYIFKRKAAEAHFRNQFNQVCFFGHTHVPLAFIRNDQQTEKGFYDELLIRPNAQYLINVGSVGQPRDRNPNAAYVVYDTATNTIQMRRVEYDIETAQKKIRAAGLPFRNALRLSSGR
jgi:predicted phosphodiesterase